MITRKLQLLTALLVAWTAIPRETANAQIYASSPMISNISSCDTCGLEESICQCVPVWRPYASMELIWMNRSQGDPRPFIEDFATLRIEADVADMQYMVKAGFRGTVGIEHASGRAVEIRYFEIRDQPALYHAGGFSLDYMMFNNLSLLGSPGITSAMESDLYSGEINGLLRPWGRFRPIIGARWLRLNEQWNVFATPLPTLGDTAKLSNEMFGGQLGFDLCVWESDDSRLRFDTRLLGVLLANDVDLAANRHAGATVLNAFSATDSQFAYGGQIDFTARWQPNRNVALFAGYTGLWLQQVALITDQSDDFTLSTGIGAFDYGDVAFHGGHFGVELTW